MRTITAKTPVDLIGLVPGILGFAPEESMVLMTFGGGPTARIDVPADVREIEPMLDATEPVRPYLAQYALLFYTGNHAMADAVADAFLMRFPTDGCIDVIRVFEGCYWSRIDGAEGVRYVANTFDLPVEHLSRAELEDSFKHTQGHLDEALATYVPTVTDGEYLHRPLPERFTDDELVEFAFHAQNKAIRDKAWESITRDKACMEFWSDAARRIDSQPVRELAAFSAWQAGDGARAWVLVDLSEPTPLIKSVTTCLENAVHPDAWDEFLAGLEED